MLSQWELLALRTGVFVDPLALALLSNLHVNLSVFLGRLNHHSRAQGKYMDGINEYWIIHWVKMQE